MSADEDEQWEVLRIVGERLKNGKTQFLVKWKDGSEPWSQDQYDEWKWHTETDCPDLIAEFRAKQEQDQLLKKKKKKEERKSRKSKGTTSEKKKDKKSAPNSDEDDDQPKKSKKKKAIIVSDEESSPSVRSKSDGGSKERSISRTRRRSGKGSNRLETEDKSNLSGNDEEDDDDAAELTKRDDRLFRSPSPGHKTPKTEIQSGELDDTERRRERGTSFLDEDEDEMNEIGDNMGSMTMEGQEREPLMVSVKEEPMKNAMSIGTAREEEEEHDHMNQLGDEQLMNAMDDNNEEMDAQEDNEDNESNGSEDVADDDSKAESSDEIEQEQDNRREWEEEEDIPDCETGESGGDIMDLNDTTLYKVHENGDEVLGYRINKDKKGEIVSHEFRNYEGGRCLFYRVFFEDLNKSQLIAEAIVHEFDPIGLEEYQEEYRIQSEKLRLERQAKNYKEEVLRRNIEAAKKAEKERREGRRAH